MCPGESTFTKSMPAASKCVFHVRQNSAAHSGFAVGIAMPLGSVSNADRLTRSLGSSNARVPIRIPLLVVLAPIIVGFGLAGERVHIHATPIPLERLPYADVPHAEVVFEHVNGVRESLREARCVGVKTG